VDEARHLLPEGQAHQQHARPERTCKFFFLEDM
jgi:hypothetical protein